MCLAAIPARIVRDGNYGQLRLSEAVVAARGDQLSFGRTTIGGGTVLDPAPPRGLDPERLALLDGGDAKAIVRHLARADDVGRSTGAGLLTAAELESGLSGLAQTDNFYYRPEWLEAQQVAVAQRPRAGRGSSPRPGRLTHRASFPSSPGVLRSSGSSTSRSTTGRRTCRVPPALLVTVRPTQSGSRRRCSTPVRPAPGRRARARPLSEARGRWFASRMVMPYPRPPTRRREAAVARTRASGSIELARFATCSASRAGRRSSSLERLDVDGVTRRARGTSASQAGGASQSVMPNAQLVGEIQQRLGSRSGSGMGPVAQPVFKTGAVVQPTAR